MDVRYLATAAAVAFLAVAAACMPSVAKAPPAAQCGKEKVSEIFELATRDEPEVVVDCTLPRVEPNFVITKRLIVQGAGGAGVTFDCNGNMVDSSRVPELSEENATRDMLLIRSSGAGGADDPSWSRPTDVTIKNCKVIGATRVLGMQDLDDLRSSSQTDGHPNRMRKIAPNRVSFENVTITGRARVPVYVGVGVTQFTLRDSELNGRSDGPALYLDAESSQAVIRGNYIHTETSRELIAVDASHFNKIVNNRFSALSNGGIYFYRNCGERRVVRHTTPSYNEVVNNVFYYDKYDGERPSVYLGSRNGSPGYCDEDDGYPVGSSASNLDYAQQNVVMQNQIYKLPTTLMIRQGRESDSPNYIDYNTTVESPASRPAGCFVPEVHRMGRDFVLDGETVGDRRVCRDGDLLLTQ